MFIKNFQLCIKRPTSENSENVVLFIFISSFVSFGACFFIQYFFDVVKDHTPNRKSLRELIIRRSKVPQKNVSCECLNVDQ